MFCLLFLLPGIIFPLIFAWLPPFCLVLLLNAPVSQEHTPPFLSVVATKPLLQQTYHISVENFLPHSLRQPFHSYPSIHKHLTFLSFSLILWLASYFSEKPGALVRKLQYLLTTKSFILFVFVCQLCLYLLWMDSLPYPGPTLLLWDDLILQKHCLIAPHALPSLTCTILISKHAVMSPTTNKTVW